ncbi:proline-rich protein 33 isoform X2 [Melanerpes formicivorus]|uniref:proline-rich protein 33 isoform X2 n=1 Tax=Melanerpes formicivorus TaxID=211600 RepID=UPI00358EF7B6
MEANHTPMTMLITVSSSIQAAPLRHHLPPPPTLPKPGKDNLRLQRLLKKAAKKNAALASEQAKAFRSSLSPVNEASPDLEQDEEAAQEERPEPAAPQPCGRPPTGLPGRALPPRICSPFRRSKPFALKVTEQRRIAEHLKLTAASAMPLLHRQPEATDALLPSPHSPAPSPLPQLPPSSPPSKEQAPEVTQGAMGHGHFHSIKAPRAKTPTPHQTQRTASQEERRSLSPAPEASCPEPSLGQVPTLLDDSMATAPAPEPPLLSAPEVAPPRQASRPAPTEESTRAPSPKPQPSNGHTDKPVTHQNDAEVSGSESAPELPQQDGDAQKPPAPSAPWRQAQPGAAAPAPADNTRATSTDTEAEQDTQPQPTPSLPNTSPPLKAEPALPTEAARPPGASAGGWHRLKKHLLVQPEAPSFPEPEPEQLSREEGSKKEDTSQAVVSQDCKPYKSKASRMWDAILYQITAGKEKQQQQQAEEKQQRKEANLFLPRRLPILLHKPRFDARKLKELAAKPMTKISTVFEVSRFRAEGAEKHPKSFNRTASGWSGS